MNSRILMLLLLIALLTGLCTACSQTKDHSSTFSSEEYWETARTDMTADASVSGTLEVPGKRQLSELSDTDLIAFMLENGVDFTGIPNPAEDTKTVEEIRKNIADIEADPYGFMGHASAAEINLGLEKERRAVCTYYDWPLIRLT